MKQTKLLTLAVAVWSLSLVWCGDVQQGTSWTGTDISIISWTYNSSALVSNDGSWTGYNINVSATLSWTTLAWIDVTFTSSWWKIDQYQTEFMTNIKSKIIGKDFVSNFNEIKAAWYVSWASTTSTAFWRALDEIKSQAIK